MVTYGEDILALEALLLKSVPPFDRHGMAAGFQAPRLQEEAGERP